MLVEVTILVLIIFMIWHSFKRPSNYPPGFWGVPLLGYIPFGKKSPVQLLTELHKKHGDIVSWRIGSKLMIFLFDYNTIKECLQGTDFVDRPIDLKLLFLFKERKEAGIGNTNGIHWSTVRRFALRHLKDLGMGKSKFTEAVQYEALEVTKDLMTKTGKPTEIGSPLLIAILNVIWQLVAGKRYDLNDKKQLEMDSLRSVLQDSFTRVSIPDVFPWIKYILPVYYLNKIMLTDIREKFSDLLEDYLEDAIAEHKKTLDSNNIRDYIDAYLLEMEKERDNPDSVFSHEDLKYGIADLFGAGSDTTTITLRWIFFYLASFPEIQKRLQAEIDEHLPGDGQMATMEDRLKMPYTEAFIHETLRYSSLATTGTFHAATRDTTVGGYFIPKGSMVQAGNYWVHYNPKYFESPKEFRPERFLDADGKFTLPKEGFLAFGIGRRSCLGELLARTELFVFLTTIVKRLSFSVEPGVKLDLNPLQNSPFFHRPNMEQKIIINTR